MTDVYRNNSDRMNNLMLFVVILTLTFASGITVTPAGNVTTGEFNQSTIAPSAMANSTELINSSSTEVAGSGAPQQTTIEVTGSSSVSGAAGAAQTAQSTTVSPGPWKAVTFALSGISAVLLIAFLAILFVLCRMKTKLRQASKTLYPITSSQEPHEYTDLEDGNSKNTQRVELTNMVVHQEEVFSSPVISPTPPEKPKRKPPSIPVGNEAPQVPLRPKKKIVNSKKSHDSAQSASASGSKTGEINSGFVNDEAADEKIHSNNSSASDISVYKEEDELYERYENAGSAELSKGVFALGEEEDEDEIDMQMPYEDPVNSSTKSQPINRQGSSSGLPDSPLQKDKIQNLPLQVEHEEAGDIEDFGYAYPESGLPDMTNIQSFDEDEFFDDPEKMTSQEEVGKDENTDEPEDKDEVSPTEGPLNDILTYDDADMVIVDDEEPECYEDFELSTRSEENVNTVPSSKEQTSWQSETDRPLFPEVPPRRDLLKEQSESESADGSSDDMNSTGKSQQGSYKFSENDVKLRPGRQVSVQGQMSPRDSYYLFMDDKTIEMSENNTQRLSMTDTIDLSGLSVLSNISGTSQVDVDFSGIMGTEKKMASNSESGDSDNS